MGLVARGARVVGDPYSVALVRCGLQQDRSDGVHNMLGLACEVVLVGGW